MSTKRVTIIAVIIVSLILIGAGGCKKSEPEASSPTSQLEQTAAKTAEQATETVAAAASIEQTVCPVMGQPINKELFTEYEGKKVYFCCPGCKEKFEADPEQYVAKLPQFKD